MPPLPKREGDSATALYALVEATGPETRREPSSPNAGLEVRADLPRGKPLPLPEREGITGIHFGAGLGGVDATMTLWDVGGGHRPCFDAEAFSSIGSPATWPGKLAVDFATGCRGPGHGVHDPGLAAGRNRMLAGCGLVRARYN